MKIYLAGKIRGNPDFMKQFHYGAAQLRTEGHLVFNPLEKDYELFGEAALGANTEEQFAKNANVSAEELRRTVFLYDTQWICETAEAIALLPGWENSKGATAEKALGEALGLQIIYL